MRADRADRSGSAAVAAEAAHNAARGEFEARAQPLAEAEKRVQRLETEAKTLSKMLSLETQQPVAAGHR